MFRPFAIAFALSCLATSAWTQTQPAQAPATAPIAKPAVKKPAPKVQAAKKPDSGPCGIGLIAATGDLFTVQKIGLTMFNIDYAEVPVPWGFDDLIFARVRAAAGGTPVRRITYAKGAFDSYYHPQPKLFRNSREELTNLVRQIASNAGCERYLVVIRLNGQLHGTNQALTGVGILNHGTSLFSRTYLFAYIRVIAFDGQTFEMRRDPSATFEGALANIAANLTKNENMRELDDSAFPASPSEAPTSPALRDGARDLLTQKLDKILPAYFKE
jgi:hypothetical protein